MCNSAKGVGGPPEGPGVLETMGKLFRFRRELEDDKRGARQAYANKDAGQSRAAHERARTEAPGAEAVVQRAAEEHRFEGEYTKSVVYGGLDGIITTFAIVAACEGGDLGGKALLCLGLSNLIADGLSMGVGDWVSEKAEHDFIASERARESWEFKNYKEGELEEMVELYTERYAVPEKEARSMLTAMSKHPDLFIDHMMAVELEMIPNSDDASAARKGVVTFLSFVGFGMVPLLGLVLGSAVFALGPSAQFRVSCAVTGACIYALGFFRGHITHQARHSAGMTMLISGGFAAVAAYSISLLMATQANGGSIGGRDPATLSSSSSTLNCANDLGG